MALEPRSTKSGSISVLVLAALAVGIFGLQLALPMISVRLAGRPADQTHRQSGSTHSNDFWNQRLRFDGLLDLQNSSHFFDTDYNSGTVLGDELIVIWRPPLQDVPVRADVIRINLRTGQSTSSPAPHDAGKVLSDGHQLFWLPEDRAAATKEFLFEGRPARFEDYFGAG